MPLCHRLDERSEPIRAMGLNGSIYGRDEIGERIVEVVYFALTLIILFLYVHHGLCPPATKNVNRRKKFQSFTQCECDMIMLWLN